MNPIKKLAGQTAIYGLSSIIPRFLNYLLVPFYTRVFGTVDNGVLTEFYAYAVFLNIVLTYGMETAFFRFTQTETNKNKVYGTSFYAILFTSSIFVIVISSFSGGIANILDYPGNREYIIYFAFILALDAILAIPFVHLRSENKPIRFATYKILGVVINIAANIFFLVVCPLIEKKHPGFLPSIVYNPSIGVGYVFISNLLASIFTCIMFVSDFIKIKLIFDLQLFKKMLLYSLPLLVAGFAGSINETLDRVLLKHLLPDSSIPMAQLGIYGANIKMAVLMTLFIQMFRFAAEPFFFNYAKEKDSRQVFADVSKYFFFFGLIIFLGVMSNIEIVKYFEGEAFRVGIAVVPVMLMANLFLGVYFNLSVWYKLTNNTSYGAYITIIGAIITIIINVLFVRTFGYFASAYARLICYIFMTVICYLYGQKIYRIPYNLRRAGFYLSLTLILYTVSQIIPFESVIVKLIFNNILLLSFITFVLLKERFLIKESTWKYKLKL